MSLTSKRKMTGKNLAAHRRNGPQSRGAVTPAGKARAARANLRHGFYSQAPNGALPALGEDPKEYGGLMNSLANNLEESLEGELVQRIGDTLWKMRRAARMQNGLAAKRVRSGLQMDQLAAGPRMLGINKIYEGLCAISRMLNRDDSTPAPGEIEDLKNAFGTAPPDDVRKIFPLLRSYGQAAANAPGPANPEGDSRPNPATAEGKERETARQELAAAIDKVVMPYARSRDTLMEEYEKIQSPENIAALMAPRDDRAMFMQRMEDSNLRQLWRLTSILVKVRKGTLE